MKNLSIRFILAVLVTGFTYVAFVSGTLDTANDHHLSSPLSFEHLLSQSKQQSNHNDLLNTGNEEVIRKLNYASFRKSLIRHRSIYYANED